MKLHFTRSFVLTRLQSRIEFLEKRYKEAIGRDAKLAEAEKAIGDYNEFGSRRMLISAAPTAERFADALKNVRFVIEHLPETPTIECDFAHAVLFGLVDPETDRVAIGFTL